MKMPKIARKYCPFCNKHTEQKIFESKKKGAFSAHPQARASFIRAKKRGKIGIGNKGRYSKKPISQWKLTGVKQAKRTDLRYECQECKRQNIIGSSFRAKKIEFVAK